MMLDRTAKSPFPDFVFADGVNFVVARVDPAVLPLAAGRGSFAIDSREDRPGFIVGLADRLRRMNVSISYILLSWDYKVCNDKWCEEDSSNHINKAEHPTKR